MRGPRSVVALAAALGLGAGLLACAGMQPVRGTPTARPGWLGYAVGDLRFEAPGSWTASGDGRALTLAARVNDHPLPPEVDGGR